MLGFIDLPFHCCLVTFHRLATEHADGDPKFRHFHVRQPAGERAVGLVMHQQIFEGDAVFAGRHHFEIENIVVDADALIAVDAKDQRLAMLLDPII